MINIIRRVDNFELSFDIKLKSITFTKHKAMPIKINKNMRQFGVAHEI